MPILNYTASALRIRKDDDTTLVLPPQGKVGMVRNAKRIHEGVKIREAATQRRRDPEDIVEIPAPQEGVIYVVSAAVAFAANREDVMCPGLLLPDGRYDGLVTGRQVRLTD